jgi:DNA-binding transcriptional LysR family regulator
MDWNDLRYFVAVAEAGTLVGAGRALGVEHTTVARRITALETALNARLFARGPDGLALTAAGEAILPQVETIRREVDAIGRAVSGQDLKIEGKVRLTIPESMTTYVLQALTQLRERHPGLMVEIVSDNRELDLRRGEADLALRIRDVKDPELVARRLAIAGWALYAAPAYIERKGIPASPQELRGHDLVGFDSSLAQIPGAVWLAEHGEGASFVLRGNSLAAVYDAAVVGFGLAALPCFMADRAAELRRISAERIGSAAIMLVAHPDLSRVARVRATMDFFIELFARDADLWSGESGRSRPPI